MTPKGGGLNVCPGNRSDCPLAPEEPFFPAEEIPKFPYSEGEDGDRGVVDGEVGERPEALLADWAEVMAEQDER